MPEPHGEQPEYIWPEQRDQSKITADQMLENSELTRQHYFELESFKTPARKFFFSEATEEMWIDPAWQFKNSLHCLPNASPEVRQHFLDRIRELFRFFPAEQIEAIEKASLHSKISVTPYELALMELKEGKVDPQDPIYRQFVPVEGDLVPDEIPEFTSNWEKPEEAIAHGLFHQKYKDRGIVRMCHDCPGYCRYCYERGNVIDDTKGEIISIAQGESIEEKRRKLAEISAKVGAIPLKQFGINQEDLIVDHDNEGQLTDQEIEQIWQNPQDLVDLYQRSQNFHQQDFEQLFGDYLKKDPRAKEVKEIIFSGGEPMLQFGKLVTAIERASNEGYQTRVHTRILTHNPFYLKREMCEQLAEAGLNELVVHVDHPREVTKDFFWKIHELQMSGIKVKMQHVFLEGVSADLETQRKLMVLMDQLRVPIHHLFHTMGGDVPVHFRTSVEKFILIAAQLIQWRQFSQIKPWRFKDLDGNNIDGDFVLPHPKGKSFGLWQEIRMADFSESDPNTWFDDAIKVEDIIWALDEEEWTNGYLDEQFGDQAALIDRDHPEKVIVPKTRFYDKEIELPDGQKKTMRVISYNHTREIWDKEKKKWIEQIETIEYPYSKKDDWQQIWEECKDIRL